MNYAIIRKDCKNLNIYCPFIIEKSEIGECNVTFLSVKYQFLLKPILALLKPEGVLSEDCTESPPILEFLLCRYNSVAVCASAEKTLSILKMCAKHNIAFFIPDDNRYVVSKALELWGMTVFVSPVVRADLLLYFEGDMPRVSENTFTADFSDEYIHNKINTEYIKNISFKTYTALYKITGDLKIQGIY